MVNLGIKKGAEAEEGVGIELVDLAWLDEVAQGLEPCKAIYM